MRNLLACAAVLALSASAADAATLDFSFTDGVTVQSPSGANAPTIANGTDTGSTVSTTNGLAGPGVEDAVTVNTTWTSPQLLFQVDPNACLKSGWDGSCNTSRGAQTSGTLDATVSVTFTFYSPTNNSVLGTLTDTAQADFAYTGYGSGTDSICWQDSGVSSTGLTLVTHAQTGGCSTNNSLNTGNGNNELMEIKLASTDYMLQLNGWNDWNEQPTIQFKDAPAAVPEPASMALLGSGLLGVGFLAYQRRRKRVRQALTA